MKNLLLLLGLLTLNACTTLSPATEPTETVSAKADGESKPQNARQKAVLEAIDNFKK